MTAASVNLPGTNVTIADGALGSASGAGADVAALIGACTGGVVNTVYSFADASALAAALGSGPLVEAAALLIKVSGKPVLCVPIDASVDGAVGAITKNGGAQTDLTCTTAPNDAYELVVQITKAGARGTARFKYALDASNPAGPTYSPEIVTAATYAIPGTGITLAFASVNYVLADLYTATCTGPGYTASDLQAAYGALVADPRAWRMLMVVGEASDVTGSASIASALDTLLSGSQAAYRYAWAGIQAADDTDANLLTGFASFASKRVSVAAGFAEVQSQLTGRTQKRGALWLAMARALAAPISQDLGQVDVGPLTAAVKLLRDEAATPGLDGAGFLTLRTHVGLAGAYVCNPRILAPAGSDYWLIQYRQVMDVACATARASLLLWLNRPLTTNADGTLEEGQAQSIEDSARADLVTALVNPQHATQASVVMDRTLNLLTSSTIRARVRVQPKGYPKVIEIDIGFQNPRLAAA